MSEYSDKTNPWIEPEDYYDGYKESIEKLKSMPELVEFEKLCYLVFTTPDGKHLLQEIEKRYLIPALCSPRTPDYSTMVVYTEGFKDAFRNIKACVISHEQRCKAEIK